MELPSPFSGTITELKAEAGEEIKVGDVVLVYQTAEKDGGGDETGEPQAHDADDELKDKVTPLPAGVSSVASASPALRVQAAPSVRQLARELSVDLTKIQGSGPGGRILMKDVSASVASAEQPSGTDSQRSQDGRGAAPSVPRAFQHRLPAAFKPGARVKLHGLRRKIAEHMVLAKRTIPHYSYVDQCDVSELVRLRESLQESFSQVGVKLTYLAFVIKAVVAALKEIPIVNASLDEQAGEIVLHDRYHIGIAVATPSGLTVPVVRNSDAMDLGQIAREIERLSSEARAGRTRLEDLRGSTFTVTSIGGIGGLISSPIINHPEAGILGIGKIVKQPVYDSQGNIHPASLMYLSFSFDHRVVDGAVAAEFGNAIIRRLQNPARLLLPERLA
jgi:pyruvate dehydrogenase E2 component (dihydrolipoamide acetyltransferase)/2-oxoisovalerate dehydrogenase E2 component (dihydrolipoyl transacylase)